MLIQKRGTNDIVFLVKNSILPKDDISTAAMLRILAEKAFKESGITIKGSIELETFSSVDETMVFAHEKKQIELYKFESAEDVFDAALQLAESKKQMNASLIFSDGYYYIAVQDNISIKPLMSEYDGKQITNSADVNDILFGSKTLTDINSLAKLYCGRKNNG